MAKRKINQLYDYLFEYYRANTEELLELFEVIKFPYDETDENYLETIAIKVVHSLMGIGIIVHTGKTVLEVNDIEFLAALNKKDFNLCRLILIDYFYHVFIGVSVKWVDEPKRLTRQLLIPIRNTINDLMCAIISSLRAEEKQVAQLTTPFISFLVSNDVDEIVANLSNSANLYPILSLMDCKQIHLIYGELGDYDFKVKLLKPKYISSPASYYKNVIVKKAKGYGIYEDKIEDLYSYLCEPESVTLPFDFEDANIKELNDFINIDFELTTLHYLGIDVDAFIESLVDEEDAKEIDSILA